MRPTLLSNFILQPLFFWLASVVLFIMGWKTKGSFPDIKKYIMIAAPHSSNWDFVFFLAIIFKFKISVHWMAKNTMFKWPFGWLLRRLGGIPIDRSVKQNVVQSMADAFDDTEELIITIAPSGTRGKVMKWKTGFYHIAKLANVPLVCGFIDYKAKTIGVGPTFDTSDDFEGDMQGIKDFYEKFSGKS